MFMAGAMIFQSVPIDFLLHVCVTTLVGTEALSGLLVEWGFALPAVRFAQLNGFRFRITHSNPSCIAALKGADTLWECGTTPFEVAQQVIVLDDYA
jgi:hypothetical protein|tara:strand:- start:318 stop:605 length:288 start_codon:yes stop_codon:yes gene_type:complete